VPGLAEQLTARELEVLVLLAAGMPNPRIAEQLVVTLDTVKKHVSHLLGKLGAANRTEAVTRARQLGLIPLATHRSRPPGRHRRAPGRPSGTVVPGSGLRKIPPACPPSGDVPRRCRIIRSSRTVRQQGRAPPGGRARTWPRR
jgi:DNA-binding CsgD family transcriptional regulator